MEAGLSAVIRMAVFILITVFLLGFSWRHLQNPKCHGFYRFFAFEGTSIIVLLNLPFWFRNPFSPLQLLSWILILSSILFIVWGFHVLTKHGGSRGRIEGSENLAFENTITLVSTGLFKYIRHPMYSSLLLLSWGAFLKHITIQGALSTLITSAFLVATAKTEEKENIAFFGSSYEAYIKKSKMFIPHLF